MLIPKKLLPSLMCTLAASGAWALPEDQQAPIELEANRLQWQQEAGIATYSGQVRIRQGSLQIQADQVQVVRSAQGGIASLRASATQDQKLHFQYQPTHQDPSVHAYAQILKYDTQAQKIILQGQARLQQGADTFTGEYIEYDLKNRNILAQGQKTSQDQSDQRVRIILHPNARPSTSSQPSE